MRNNSSIEVQRRRDERLATYATVSVALCHHCGNFFLAVPSDVARGNARFCRRGCYNAFKSASMEERFWRGIDKRGPDECWPWKRATASGYGVLPLPGHAAGYVEIHRFSYELHISPIPEGQIVRHRCPRGPLKTCGNPAHLKLGTQWDNMQDKIADGNQPRGDEAPARKYPERMPRGERHKNSKLTEAAVRDIRRRAAPPEGVSFSALARQYRVAVSIVSDAFHRRTWKHVE